MNIGARLEAIGKLVPPGCVLADIGTDHGYLPAQLVLNGTVKAAIAGDVAEGPCQAAQSTVQAYGLTEKIKVRLGSGLQVLKNGEADCIVIAGMGASTMIEILQQDLPKAYLARRLVLQPMAGAPTLRKWLVEHGWALVAEDLALEGQRLYEIIAAERGGAVEYSDAELEVGPLLLKTNHVLLPLHLQKLLAGYNGLLTAMERSSEARLSAKYQKTARLAQEVEALRNAGNS